MQFISHVGIGPHLKYECSSKATASWDRNAIWTDKSASVYKSGPPGRKTGYSDSRTCLTANGREADYTAKWISSGLPTNRELMTTARSANRKA
jgi:hypothetical protein